MVLVTKPQHIAGYWVAHKQVWSDCESSVEFSSVSEALRSHDSDIKPLFYSPKLPLQLFFNLHIMNIFWYKHR